MIEQVEDRSSEEQFELERIAEDEFSKCGKSRIKYTRALLLEFTEKEACRKLPRKFDVLILRQLDGESDRAIEHKIISGDSSAHGPAPTTRWNLDFRGERRDKRHTFVPSKESHLQINCSLERRDTINQQLPLESRHDAGILGPKIQKADLFQLNKCGNPYRPPHFHKIMQQPLPVVSEQVVESSGESDQRSSADSITVADESRCGSPRAGINETTKIPLGECEDSWRNNEGNEVIGASETLECGGIFEDDQLTFDGFWNEILEFLHQHQESTTISSTNTNTPDSEFETRFSDEDTLISVGHYPVPDDFNSVNLVNSDHVANSEAGISQPYEDSLISIYAPNSSMPGLYSDSADNVTSNQAVNIRENSKSLNVTNKDDRSMTASCKAPSFLDSSGLVTQGKLRSPLSHSQTSTNSFGPGKNSLYLGNDRMNFLPKFMTTPHIVPYIPTLNCFTHDRSCQEGKTLMNTKANGPLVQYSLLQQPNIFPEQQNQLLVNTSCPNPIKQAATSDLSAMQLLSLTSRQATYQGFGKSNTVAKRPVILGGLGDEQASGFCHTQHY